MIRKAKKYLFAATRSLVLLVTLISLIGGGAGAASRLFEGFKDKESPNNYEFRPASIAPSPEEGEGAIDAMSGSSKPNSEPIAEISQPWILPLTPQQNSPRFSRIKITSGLVATDSHDESPNSSETRSQVSPSLGQTTTLVGARPSGTS